MRPSSQAATREPPTVLPWRDARALVEVRDYKRADLEGATLIVSVPQAHLGNLLFTDHILEQHRMDQVAVLDSPMFPPIATVRRGKPRFPARIHAQPEQGLAVLRCEFTPAPWLARPLARAILDWARAQRLERVVVLDALHHEAAEGAAGPSRKLWFAASLPGARETAQQAGLDELDDGILGGLPAVLLLEGRFAEVQVLGLFAEVAEPLDDARSALSFARALPQLLPGLRIDPQKLEDELGQLERTVRQLREQALRTAKAPEDGPEAAPPMYG